MEVKTVLAPSIAKLENVLEELKKRRDNLDAIIDKNMNKMVREMNIAPENHAKRLENIRTELTRIFSKEISQAIDIAQKEKDALESASDVI